MNRYLLAAALMCSLSTGAFAVFKEQTLQDRQQAACADDVQKLCADTIPDVDKTKACMNAKRSQVSAKCAKMYDVKQ